MTDFSHILSWYTGKAQAAIRDYVLPTLAAAEREESWPPKASRAVHAALGKQSVAARFARAHERDEHQDGDVGRLGDVMAVRGSRYYESKVRSWDLLHAMRFGQFSHAPEMLALADQLAPHCACGAERAALAVARGWAADFAPLAALVARLDATRPRPTFAFGEISRTVSRNVGQAMGLAFESVRCPEIRYHREEQVGEDGKLAISWRVEILWPEGTRHGKSTFRGSHQCQACGHAIHNWYNWVPLVVDRAGEASGEPPSSLWVGRDCARKLFGCVVTGKDVAFRREAPVTSAGAANAGVSRSSI